MIVISDTSVLSALLQIDRLSLLCELFEEVIIPFTVFEELAELTRFGVSIQEIHDANWILIRPVSDLSVVESYDLDAGEKAAIALALELNADYLLIDELQGRQVAQELMLTITGTLGLLIEAKREGIIPLVRPLMDELIHTARFWINNRLYQNVLRLAGE